MEDYLISRFIIRSVGVVGVAVAMMATAGLILSMARAVGEEIGWRGFLIWELRKLMPFWAVGLVSGVIWGLWHVPAILGTDYNAGTGSLAFQVALFFANVITASVIFAYFTFRARSLWQEAALLSRRFPGTGVRIRARCTGRVAAFRANAQHRCDRRVLVASVRALPVDSI